MKSALYPEPAIVFYPSLAATLGLEEAVLLSVLSSITHYAQYTTKGHYNWYTLPARDLDGALPFWGRNDIQRVCNLLREKGVLIIASAPLSDSSTEFKFAFNEREQSAANHAQQSHHQQAARTNTTRTAQPSTQNAHKSSHTLGVGNDIKAMEYEHRESQTHKSLIAKHWRPDGEILAQLSQHGIPEQFAHEQVPEFITYWRERGETQHSWGAKFVQRVIIKWREFETEQFRREGEHGMFANWRPSEDALEILVSHAEINRDFIEDAIPEFILFWRERGDVLKTWNSKFIQHVRVQWARFNSTIEHNSEPRAIPQNWRPSNDVYDVLRLANIDINFAESLVKEFVLYWRDSNKIYSSWNTKFLQHVKLMWARRHSFQNANTRENSQKTRTTREMSFEQELNDRSWA